MMITIIYRDVESFKVVCTETFESWDDANRAKAEALKSGLIPEVRL